MSERGESKYGGRGKRVSAGLVCLVFVGFVVWWFFGGVPLLPVGETSKCSECSGNLYMIFLSVVGESGRTPPSVDNVIGGKECAPFLRCPSAQRPAGSRDYVVVMDAAVWRAQEAPPLALAWDDEPRHGSRRNVLLQGGLVRTMADEEFQSELDRLRSRSIAVRPTN